MTTAQRTEANPFALMIEPEAVFAALAGSDRLARLKSRICRPLDKAVVVGNTEDSGEEITDAASIENVAAEQREPGF